MKKLMILMSVSLLMSSLAFAQDTQGAASTSASIGCIDYQVAIQGCKEGEKEGKKLKAKQDQLEAQLAKEGEPYRKAVEEYSAKRATMSKAAQETEEQRLMKMKRDLESKVEEVQLELKLEVQKVMEALGKEAETAVKEVAVKNKLDIIIDARSGQVLYVSDNAMYTGDLVKEMDKNYNAKVAKANTAKKPGA